MNPSWLLFYRFELCTFLNSHVPIASLHNEVCMTHFTPGIFGVMNVYSIELNLLQL